MSHLYPPPIRQTHLRSAGVCLAQVSNTSAALRQGPALCAAIYARLDCTARTGPVRSGGRRTGRKLGGQKNPACVARVPATRRRPPAGPGCLMAARRWYQVCIDSLTTGSPDSYHSLSNFNAVDVAFGFSRSFPSLGLSLFLGLSDKDFGESHPERGKTTQ